MFVGLFDTVSGRYQDIITTSEAIRDNREKAQTAADEIFNLTDKYQKLGEAMTPEDAQKIKDNLDTIGSAIKDNLQDMGGSPDSAVPGRHGRFKQPMRKSSRYGYPQGV